MEDHFLNYVRAWVIAMAVTVHDTWLWLGNTYTQLTMTAMISWWGLVGRGPVNRTTLLSATTAGEDVTWPVKQFYANTEVVSPFKLQRWLMKFGITASHVDIIFLQDGQLCLARIDPENDMELFTKQPITDCDISLDHVCGIKYEL